MKLKHILIGVGVLLVLLVGANFAGLIGGETTEKVTIDKAGDKKVVETVTASGKIQPETEVKLSSEVSGEVTELLVKEGDVVKKGQLLCKVRPDILQSGYERAVASYNSQKAAVASSQQQLIQNQANFANSEATYKRNVELYNKKVISASEFDAAKAVPLRYYGAGTASVPGKLVQTLTYNADGTVATVKDGNNNVIIRGSNPFSPRESLASAGAMIDEKSNSFGRSSRKNTR